jgi:lipopolysaccharide/colanic/teichoic acid biosynthesis glycosyltransferase
MLSTNSIKKSSALEQSVLEFGYRVGVINTSWLGRLFDISGSFLALLLFGWLFLLIAILIKITSKGSIIYSQERIGQYGVPFNIYKFRTMYVDSEKNGPALSYSDDPRVTSFGKLLRKLHLDELPQFFNVLIGDMSIIGTRPEREYYIRQIIKKSPNYTQILKNKPGITSWGQLKFGYAKNVDEMVERLSYDLYYIQHKNTIMNIKIIIYTTLVIALGKNKIFKS